MAKERQQRKEKYHVRTILVLMNCIRILLRELMIKIAEQKTPRGDHKWEVDDYLRHNRRRIERKIMKIDKNDRYRYILYPRDATMKTDFGKWDLTLYTFLLIEIVMVEGKIKKNLQTVFGIRDKICRLKSSEVTRNVWKGYRKQIVRAKKVLYKENNDEELKNRVERRLRQIEKGKMKRKDINDVLDRWKKLECKETENSTGSGKTGVDRFYTVETMLSEVCCQVMQAVVRKRASDKGHWGLGSFLRQNEPRITRQIHAFDKWGRAGEILFPRKGETKIEDWEISLLCWVLLNVCYLGEIEVDGHKLVADAIGKFRTIRNETTHLRDRTLSQDKYDSYMEDMQRCVRDCLDFLQDDELSKDINAQIEDIQNGDTDKEETMRRCQISFKKMRTEHDSEKSHLEDHANIQRELSIIVSNFRGVTIPECQLELMIESCGEHCNQMLSKLLVDKINKAIKYGTASTSCNDRMETAKEDSELTTPESDDIEMATTVSEDDELTTALVSLIDTWKSKGWNPICSTQGSVLLQIHCTNFYTLSELYKTYKHDGSTLHVSEVQDAVQRLTGDQVKLRFVMYDIEMFRCMEKIVSGLFEKVNVENTTDRPTNTNNGSRVDILMKPFTKEANDTKPEISGLNCKDVCEQLERVASVLRKRTGLMSCSIRMNAHNLDLQQVQHETDTFTYHENERYARIADNTDIFQNSECYLEIPRAMETTDSNFSEGSMSDNMETDNPNLTEEEQIGDSYDAKRNEPVKCHPCSLLSKTSFAVNESEENMCEDCVESLAKQKASPTHNPLPFDEIKKSSIYNCSPCNESDKVSSAVTYCDYCEEYLCTECTHSHKIRKATRLHESLAVELLKDQARQSDEMFPLCDSCKDNSIDSVSSNYCEDCEEHLCEPCTKSHKSRKATKSHVPVPISSMRQKVNKEANDNDRKLCIPCLIIVHKKEAKSFCVECEELLCKECTNQHRSKMFSKTHTLEGPASVEYDTRHCEVCDLEKEEVVFCNVCEEALCHYCAQKHAQSKASKSHSTKSVESKTLNRVLFCESCKKHDELRKAQSFCNTCEENYCETCTRRHRRRKMTKLHELTNPALSLTASKQELNLCDECKATSLQAKTNYFCLFCKMKLCPSCQQVHTKQKATTNHKVVDIDAAQNTDAKICDQCEYGQVAYKHCPECQLYLCGDCSERHHLSRFTQTHILIETAENEEIKQQDCDACKTVGVAQFFCEQCGEFFCSICYNHHQSLPVNSQHQLVSVQEGMKKRMTEKGDDNNKGSRRKEIEVNFIPQKQPEKDCPGKPRASDILADSITLSWDPPSRFCEDDYYQVSFKDLDHEKKWKFCQGEYRSATAVLSDLKSNTAFIFRVRVVYEDGEGPYSDESDKVITSESPAARIVKLLTVKEKGNPSPIKYALPITELRPARNERAKTKKFEVGSSPIQDGKSKTIMLVGTTGTGKSTLVDALVNYALGVNRDDPFRFTVIDLDQEEKDRVKNQALSQTEWITCYTLNPEKGSRLTYKLHIIDTPGFGDTRGLERDKYSDISSSCSSPMFWHMGLKSFRGFFDHLEQVETKSLQLTKDVLDERSRLEATVKNLQPLVDAALTKLNCLKQEIQIIEKNSSMIKGNNNFEYEVAEKHQKKRELPKGLHVSKCTECNFTSHDNCVFANNEDKAKCCSMDESGNCKICPDKCHWTKHANTTYIFDYVTVKVKKTYADMQKQYQEATGKLLSKEQIVEKLGVKLSDLLCDFEDMMFVIKSCNERLKEISLTSNPLLVTEHIDLMIENEKLEKKPGF